MAHSWLREFLAPERGRDVPIEEFPSLFNMESHTGFCGFAFTIVWLGLAYKNFPELWAPESQGLLYFSGLLAAIFIGLAWASMATSNFVNNRVKSISESSDIERRRRAAFWVRIGIMVYSGAFMLVCCLMIWLTGGTASPFTPFYVMIFTLTIERMHQPHPGFYVLAAYATCLLAACGLSLYNPFIDERVMRKILTSNFQWWITVGFLFASLVVPTISAYFIQSGHARRRERAGLTKSDGKSA